MSGLLGAVVAGAVEGGADQHIKTVEEEIKATRTKNLERIKQANRLEVTDHTASINAAATDKQNEFAAAESEKNRASREKIAKQGLLSKAKAAKETKPDTLAYKRLDEYETKLFGKKFRPGVWQKNDKVPSAEELKSYNAMRIAVNQEPLVLNTEKFDPFGPNKFRNTTQWQLQEAGQEEVVDVEDPALKTPPPAAGTKPPIDAAKEVSAAQAAVTSSNFENKGDLMAGVRAHTEGKSPAFQAAYRAAIREKYPDLLNLAAHGETITKAMPQRAQQIGNKTFQ